VAKKFESRPSFTHFDDHLSIHIGEEASLWIDWACLPGPLRLEDASTMQAQHEKLNPAR
jgi:hypothetical protein